ncbi:hypothetical protein SAMN04488577_2454 [Bacillus sp. cl95]|nr:hypothetical protein [Bacillus sp. UNCCL13]SFA88664.1 hypothetical protein SAMN02799634_102336 [Bacillus sp. UNCCL13]SFQ84665.1 hypothetical protein SAMN04488577_2454 [Bacillus sp. cl95]
MVFRNIDMKIKDINMIFEYIDAILKDIDELTNSDIFNTDGGIREK